jgi:hypothetical protein
VTISEPDALGLDLVLRGLAPERWNEPPRQAHLDVLPTSIGTVGVPGCASRRRRAATPECQIPESPCAGPTLSTKNAARLASGGP